MAETRNSLGWWLVCALGGALIAYLYAVLRVEPLAHDSAMSSWQWFWGSYGSFLRRGLLLGGVAGLVAIRLLPATLGRRRDV